MLKAHTLALLLTALGGCADSAVVMSDVAIDGAWVDGADAADGSAFADGADTADLAGDTPQMDQLHHDDEGLEPPLDDGVGDSLDDAQPDDGMTDGADEGLHDADLPPPPSRCDVGEFTITCDHQTTTLFTGVSGVFPREVHHQVPLGEAPADGWPVAILFQGSLFTAELFWAIFDAPLGAFNQVLLTKTLLDAGFAVVTPEALGDGATAWQTNVPPASLTWSLSSDHAFMLDMFTAIEDGDFGPLNPDMMYATGISSGGYMTSRMDKEYRERFKALAIHSGSYATCAGPVCSVPSDLDAEHLPTLFIHGGVDLVVPQWTMELYRDALDDIGVATQTLTQSDAAHEWLDAAPEAIRDWFLSH